MAPHLPDCAVNPATSPHARNAGGRAHAGLLRRRRRAQARSIVAMISMAQPRFPRPPRLVRRRNRRLYCRPPLNHAVRLKGATDSLQRGV
jgi:hypothetical protein